MEGSKQEIGISPTEKLMLLALKGNELYGVEIGKAVMLATEGKRRLTRGSLYPLLGQLEKKGLVISRWGDESLRSNEQETKRGARRRYYQLTQLGEEIVNQNNDRIRVAPAK
jgi:DNA-binding PadR family transcriptional regulator